MAQLKTKGEFYDEQQEKHDAYLKNGFRLERTRRTRDGLTIRRYSKRDE